MTPIFALKHVGINPQGEDPEAIAQVFNHVFNLEYKPGNSSIFAGTAVEVMRENYLGTSGHIAFETEDVQKAVEYLEGKGVSFNKLTAKYTKHGELNAIYLADEIGGFAVHLLKK